MNNEFLIEAIENKNDLYVRGQFNGVSVRARFSYEVSYGSGVTSTVKAIRVQNKLVYIADKTALEDGEFYDEAENAIQMVNAIERRLNSSIRPHSNGRFGYTCDIDED